jgi:hypothetical protein
MCGLSAESVKDVSVVLNGWFAGLGRLIMNMNSFATSHPRRGTVLPVTVFICVLSAIAVTYMIGTLFDQQRLNMRRNDLSRAYFAAEAGVQQVLNWGNNPSQYDTSLSEKQRLFYRDSSGAFPNLSATLSGGEYLISPAKLGSFTSKYGYTVSSVKSITLVPPNAAIDPIACSFKVRSVGQTPSGLQRTILAYINPNALAATSVVLPAGLISMATASQSGNGTVHWGESWSKGDFAMLNKSQSGYLDPASGAAYDQWTKIRTEGKIVFPNNWTASSIVTKSGVASIKQGDYWDYTTGSSDPYRFYPALGSVAISDYTGTGTMVTPPTEARATGDYAKALQQFIPSGVLKWPDMAGLYSTLKAQAISHGRYYGTDASGNVYRDGVKDAAHLVSSFTAEFQVADRSIAAYDLVFIDTTNGSAPASNGSNLSTISSTGNSTGLKGVFWIGANFFVAGSGNPPLLANVEKPDGTVTSLSTVYLDGLLYAAGTVGAQGNPQVFGAVVAEKGFVGGGTWDIYYNHKLASGLDLPAGNLGSAFSISMQNNY